MAGNQTQKRRRARPAIRAGGQRPVRGNSVAAQLCARFERRRAALAVDLALANQVVLQEEDHTDQPDGHDDQKYGISIHEYFSASVGSPLLSPRNGAEKRHQLLDFWAESQSYA